MKIKVFSYSQLDTFIHKLSGLTKLICFLLMTTSVMMTYDIRVILCIMVISLVLMKIAKITFHQIKTMLIYVFIFLIANFILTFLFDPGYGARVYGTEHILFSIAGPYVVTEEELFYLITKFFKYLSVIPLGIIFILTTNPSEFASSLNGIGVSYKVGTALSLTLRYFPDVTRDYQTISIAQQARGLELSKKAKMKDRIKSIAAILTPMIFTTMDRINLISNAMDLRGFGKSKTRTWYSKRPLTMKDYGSMIFCALVLFAALFVRYQINHSMFYNPFI
ncbi:MAG: energy-coupling factor transporter transmembrane protein EcfT [Solobacterium sp.]|jgi:energy-coupling factor transport system permease protein|nr:energy-coupling factor transporter transmembrane protein EcfT [Solobacterium sp.]MCH4221913.1 energy-coupling factor transporter transmembrane protein EcfT [Solobacterium sp.]MCH4265227.1 energy-coupling factor transporter transmembrane protein EcfT [Solobacterium sp.]